MCHHITDGRQLLIGAFLHLVRAIELHGGRDDHTIDVHFVAEHLFVLIGCLGIAHTTFRSSSICHQGTHLVTLADNDDTRIGNFRILVSVDMVLILVDGHAVRRYCPPF